jgi:hypothetical protein
MTKDEKNLLEVTKGIRVGDLVRNEYGPELGLVIGYWNGYGGFNSTTGQFEKLLEAETMLKGKTIVEILEVVCGVIVLSFEDTSLHIPYYFREVEKVA